MRTDKIIYIGIWETAHLCAKCGEYLSTSAVLSHWMKPCHRCGSIGALCPEVIKTSRRFVCTRKYLLKPDEGYYEWSGCTSDNASLSGHPIMVSRKICNPIVTIAAAGIASGLF
jgi:hypothetical protein